MDFDVVVIGAGPGGYTAAVRSSQLGLRTAIIEKEKNLGGTCMNVGCIPTKALLQSAHTKTSIDNSSEFGIEAAVGSIDFRKMFLRAGHVISTLNDGLLGLMDSNKIRVITGTASFIDKNTLLVDGKDKITAKNVVIATGGVSRMLPLSLVPESLIREGLVWTSREAIRFGICPKRIVIIGSGAIGIEFASFYNSVGSKVTVIEIQDRILVNEDEEIAKAAARELEKKGIKFVLNTSVSKVQQHNDGVKVCYGDGKEEEADICLVAIGIIPDTDSLGLDKIDVKTERDGRVIVDDNMETSVRGIYAIGDITKPPFLAHKAVREGTICSERIAGILETRPLDPLKIPACTYSDPQIASVGMTEKDALNRGLSIRVGKAYFKGNGKALSIGESFGFIKVVFENRTGELLGAHMVGHDVTEIISVLSVAISAELTDRELIDTIFPHPTISESIRDAVLNSFGRAA